MSAQETLQALLEMTQTLGEPARELVIIGEGNTSSRIDEDSFWIKASGRSMAAIDADCFVAVRLKPILALLELEGDSTAHQQAMIDAKVDPSSSARPSVEVTFHAMLLHECADWGIRVIAHTHPVAVNQILCSGRAQEFAERRIFPDQVVVCGPRSVFLPYIDPGPPLARAMREALRGYIAQEGEPPKTILLANHGLIALAASPREALNITMMTVKAAKIFAGAAAIGEPTFMSQADIDHIYKRPDEIFRRKSWG